MPQIYSKRRAAQKRDPIPADAVYVGRPSDYGNPYQGNEAQREEACDQFAHYAAERLAREPDWLAPLVGKSLCCWCWPTRPCHAETLLRLANGLSKDDVDEIYCQRFPTRRRAKDEVPSNG